MPLEQVCQYDPARDQDVLLRGKASTKEHVLEQVMDIVDPNSVVPDIWPHLPRVRPGTTDTWRPKRGWVRVSDEVALGPEEPQPLGEPRQPAPVPQVEFEQVDNAQAIVAVGTVRKVTRKQQRKEEKEKRRIKACEEFG